jgi:hypothetical protein
MSTANNYVRGLKLEVHPRDLEDLLRRIDAHQNPPEDHLLAA